MSYDVEPTFFDKTTFQTPDNPFTLLNDWLVDAKSRKLYNYNAMCLATVDDDGLPNARMVLCKGVNPDNGTVVFYTNENSVKGQEIKNNPKVAGVFYWNTLGRSIRIRGHVTHATAEESDAYWGSRPITSRVSSALSNQSAPLEENFEQFVSKFVAECDVAEQRGDIERPPHWHGYRIWCSSIELWKEGDARVHQRIQWRRDVKLVEDKAEVGTWSVRFLQP